MVSLVCFRFLGCWRQIRKNTTETESSACVSFRAFHCFRSAFKSFTRLELICACGVDGSLDHPSRVCPVSPAPFVEETPYFVECFRLLRRESVASCLVPRGVVCCRHGAALSAFGSANDGSRCVCCSCAACVLINVIPGGVFSDYKTSASRSLLRRV